MNYTVRHRTTYEYREDVLSSRQLLHLVPRMTPQQAVHAVELTIEPVPTRRVTRRDAFDNVVDWVAFDEPHAYLEIVATSKVDVQPPPVYDAAATEPWERVHDVLEAADDEESRNAVQFLFDTSLITAPPEVVAYARASFPPGRPILAAALDLTARIHADFRYDTAVTDAATPVTEVYALRAGVCQDLAQAGIAALRAFGLAARYVSGYRRTQPPPGRARLVGADASHAWFSVWAPPLGWIDLDPTSNVVAGSDYITVAWGRCYRDVAPVHGLVTGGDEQLLTVGVDVA